MEPLCNNGWIRAQCLDDLWGKKLQKASATCFFLGGGGNGKERVHDLCKAESRGDWFVGVKSNSTCPPVYSLQMDDVKTGFVITRIVGT